MKLSLSIDLGITKEQAKRRVDIHFANQVDPLKIEAHRRKREEAISAVESGGQVAGPLLVAEAQRTGVPVLALAENILSKPDTLVEVENLRREKVEAVRAATTLSEVHDVLRSMGVDPAVLNTPAVQF